MNALQLVRSVRGLQRVRKILSVLSQHGFGHLVDRMNLGRFMPLRRRRAAADVEIETMTIGRRLVAVCNELGPTFVKLGQMATTRPDLVPADIIEDLKALQDHVGPFETDRARAIIVEDLGAPIEELFRSFGSEPLASGSIGQVYRAQTRDGLEVIVKVRRPEVEVTIRRDVFLLKQLADALETHVEETRVYRPRILIDEFEQTLLRELDFTHEASSTTRMAQALSDDCNIIIPKTLWELSSARVLTLAAVPGVNISQVLASDDPRFDRPQLASRLADLYLRQVFEVGVYHADPHPGNILVSAPAKVALIDFGQVGTVPPELATKLVALLVAATYRETDFMATVLADLNALGTETDPRELARELRILQDKYYGLPLKRLDLMTIFHEATAVMRRNDVVIPRDLVLILKTLSAVMGLVLQLDPEFDLLATFRPRIKKLIRDQVAPGRVARSAGAVAWNILGLLREGPLQLRAGLRRFAQGQWQLNVRHERLSELMSELDRSSNRLSFSVVIAAIIVGSSMVVTSDAKMRILAIPLQWFGVFGYLVAALLGLGLLWAIFRSGKLY